LLIGAYRDNEVDNSHSLMRTFRGLESSGVEIHRLILKSLQLADLTRFVRDTLHGEISDAEPLAQLVWEKTGGNPFFVRQFLQNLKQENFLKFDYKKRRWIYQIEDISRAGVTDNVIDLMTRKIQRLSPRVQNVLMVASCIGNPFDAKTLSIVSEESLEVVEVDLEEAVQEGLVIPISGRNEAENGHADPSYSFLHDRIQQAAHSLIPEEKKYYVHYEVGKLLSSHGEERIFDVANHLNLAKNLINDESELLNLAQLNLTAGRRAKSSAAFEAALEYLRTGTILLTEKHWDSNYELAFDLNLETAECEYLCGNFAEVETQTESLLKRARTKLDKARVLNLRMLQFENLTRYADSIAAARESLALFDVSFPDSAEEKQSALEREVEEIEKMLASVPPAVAGGLTSEIEKMPNVSDDKVQLSTTADVFERKIALLIDLPTMTDAETQMVMNILTDIWSAVYLTGDAVLARLISATMVKLSLLHGNAAESAYGYVTHAITVGPVLGNYASAYEWGELALRVNERFNDLSRRAKIHQQFHAHVALWRKPFRICVEHAQEACRSGLEAGDFLYAAYGAATETWTAHLIGNDLEKFVQDYLPSLALIRKLKVTSFADSHNLMLNWAQALQGKTAAPTSFSTEEFDENEYIETYRDNPFFTMVHAIMKMQLCYLFDDREAALEAAEKAGKIAHQLEGMIWTPIFDFWNGLILLSQIPSPESQDDMFAQIGTWDLSLGTGKVAELDAGQKSLAVLAENCPENFLCRSLLFSAELERVKGREISAIDLFEKAIANAAETKSIRHQALANELYAKFWLLRGQEKIAAAFLSEAIRCYADWGAFAKVEHLQGSYSETLDLQKILLTNQTSQAGADELDIFSVTKAAQAITGEIEFDNLLTKLIRITIENAGAQRGSLILEHDGEMRVFAEDSLDSKDVKLRDGLPLVEAYDLPLSVINFAQRTSENVVLNDAKNDKEYGKDEYILRFQPSSIMCVPIINQGRLRGLLYLENNAVSGAFTPERIKVCQILASQAAISLENVQLYGEMKKEAAHRRKAEETLRSVMEGTAGVTGDYFFASMVQHLADTLDVRYAFVTECRDYLQLRGKAKAKMVAFWQGDQLSENAIYELGETPCLKVFEGQTCYYPSGVQRLFPNDHDLVALNADGYLGIPLYAATGQVVGHLAVLDDKPLVHTPESESLLRIFAARAGAELERLHAEEELRIALAEVEQLKNQFHDENIYLQEEIREHHNFEEIIGDSPALLETLQKVERVAPTDATVLITGETGTGKELIARAIHNFSERRDRPLVKVNCGAISAGLVESELFGHTKGAFTGAFDKRAGRFELANGGTIFLDEVGELPMETQVKLLRVLQEGEFESVGSSKTVKIDVRIIAATNRNLEEEIEAGRFRSDLFYRLNVFPVRIPPLRERCEDIPLLVMFFLQNFARKFGRKIQNVPNDVMNQLINYDWSGNVRELQNIIERAVVLASPDETSLRVELIPFFATQSESKQVFSAKASSSNIYASIIGSPGSALQDVEKHHIIAVLEKAKWKIEGANGAAQVLNLHPNTLRSRLKKLDIQRPLK
jgi:transcriptional regulator with GAF, ATPase, and Fis domain